jgi:hypothetical protein
MDKGLIVPNWVLINGPKIPQNLSAQIVCPSPKVLDFDEQSLIGHPKSVASNLFKQQRLQHLIFIQKVPFSSVSSLVLLTKLTRNG